VGIERILRQVPDRFVEVRVLMLLHSRRVLRCKVAVTPCEASKAAGRCTRTTLVGEHAGHWKGHRRSGVWYCERCGCLRRRVVIPGGAERLAERRCRRRKLLNLALHVVGGPEGLMAVRTSRHSRARCRTKHPPGVYGHWLWWWQ